MPNGYAEERDTVLQRSHLWGTIWQIGDTVYYIGLLASVVVPLTIVAKGIRHFDSWLGFFQSLFLAAMWLVTCFPIGFGLCLALKELARRRTGVSPK